MKIKSDSSTTSENFQRLMERFSVLTDRSNFLRQRCSGLGRMECQTLQLLERYKQQKPEIRERIRKQDLTEDEVLVFLPRNLRRDYLDGKLGEAHLQELPRDLSMKALADEIGVACSRMTRIGDTLSDEIDPVSQKMRGKGMIHREPSPDDRRVILIRITEEGSKKVQSQSGHNARITDLLLEKIPDSDVAMVEKGLRAYLTALEDILPEIVEDEGADDKDCNVLG